MEAIYSSVPKITDSDKEEISILMPTLTILSILGIVVLQVYKYRKNRNLRLIK